MTLKELEAAAPAVRLFNPKALLLHERVISALALQCHCKENYRGLIACNFKEIKHVLRAFIAS